MFNVVEASIASHRAALNSGATTSVELCITYLHRIATYDLSGIHLNAFTVFNPRVLDEARASDQRRASGKPLSPLDGIPYTLKDSYKYTGLTVSAGSLAFKDLQSNEDAWVAAKLREAGAVLIGKTNMPPMAAGGMQRGLYGCALSPYNVDYLTAAFVSGSSQGAATSTAASFAAFAMGSETVSSGRSPASNNGLVCYTPSRGVISCRGLWPLYGTCDVVVPYTRSVADMAEVLDVLCQKDEETVTDFWREQTFVKLPSPSFQWTAQKQDLKGKRIGVPRAYVGEKDGKDTVVTPGVIALWETARKHLEELGAEVVLTDFPLVTKYEDDSVSGLTNNVVGAPDNWSRLERSLIIAKSWDQFLKASNHPGLGTVNGADMFPKPPDYIPDLFAEAKNAIDYPGLTKLAADVTPIWEIPGMAEMLPALEAQRKRDFEDWLDEKGFDFVVFPAQGGIGRADVEENAKSARYAMQNGIRYSNGNRALRHLGVPTMSVPMGVLHDIGMPVNLTFAGKAYADDELLDFAAAFERKSAARVEPKITPELKREAARRGM
ncbi:amidase signature enzyme [Lophium mytilinum]|uniref:Amidase signature enzyme n=1 Tax=Lophium mytilinum TaxID=390894 RepID=A0A6A6QR27_9PEZI|nr:amidase signature enzyme [Lophium mytilinum]